MLSQSVLLLFIPWILSPNSNDVLVCTVTSSKTPSFYLTLRTAMDSAGHAFPPVPCPLLVPQCHGVPPAFLLTSSLVLFSLSACSCSLLSSLGHLLLIASKRRAYRSQVYISSHGLSLWLQRWVHLSSHGCATRASNTTHLVIPIVPSASDSWVFYHHHFPRMYATLSTTPTSSDYSSASFFFFLKDQIGNILDFASHTIFVATV